MGALRERECEPWAYILALNLANMRLHRDFLLLATRLQDRYSDPRNVEILFDEELRKEKRLLDVIVPQE